MPDQRKRGASNDQCACPGSPSADAAFASAADDRLDREILLSVPGVKCGGCVAAIEGALREDPAIDSARVNQTMKRLRVTMTDGSLDPAPVVARLKELGYDAYPVEIAEGDREPAEGAQLLRAMAVAGCGAMNVMVLSVAVWAGADGMTRETFHILSALIAVPVVLYSGRPFFRSALGALRHGRLNMDVPISLAVALALGLSLYETEQGGEEVFFDAAVTLLFFLLIGRYLDQLMRDKARSAINDLSRLAPRGALAIEPSGRLEWTPLRDIAPGMALRIEPGERIPVDVRISTGATDVDRSLISGEAMPVAAGPGAVLEAGTLNLTGRIDVFAEKSADESFLSEMMRMLGAAEEGRGTYVRIADRAARLYAPVVHLLALSTFIGWYAATGDWRGSAFVAISVLIITCPCALGLAVPVAHVVAAGRLMRQGVMMKDGAALERMAEIDCAVFDKTGTLTTGAPVVASAPPGATDRAAAEALARHSSHPAARAIAAAGQSLPTPVMDAREVPGFGVEGLVGGVRARLGRAAWVSEIAKNAARVGPAFAFAGKSAATYDLKESLRPGARRTVKALQDEGLAVSMLSGDDADRAALVAGLVGIAHVRHSATPKEKIAYLAALREDGSKPLMVGDGLNDAAALAAAHVSMAPSSASDAGRTAADFVFIRDGLDAVASTRALALATAGLVRQNFGLAIAYNCIAIPLAVAGLVTPLLAAAAMSASSILVIGNSLRLNGRRVSLAPAGADARLKARPA